MTQNFPLFSKWLLCFASYYCFTLPSAGALVVCLADLVWEGKQSWEWGSRVSVMFLDSLIFTRAALFCTVNSSLARGEWPQEWWNGSKETRYLQRKRREHTAPEHHPKESSHWAGISRRAVGINELCLCSPTNCCWCWQQQFKAATGDREKEKMVLPISAPSWGFLAQDPHGNRTVTEWHPQMGLEHV